MNCKVVVPSISRLNGGVKPAVNGLYNSFADKSSIEVLSLIDDYYFEDKEDFSNIDVVGFETYPFNYSPQLMKYLDNCNMELFHLHTLWRHPHLLMSWINKKQIPIVCSPHGMLDPYIIQMQGKLKRFASSLCGFDKALKKVDVYHALCKKELEDIRAYGIKSPVAIIPNGVDLPDYVPEKREDDYKHLLFLGRVAPKKGVQLLLPAVIDLMKKANGPLDGWILDIVGWDDGNLMTTLKEMVDSVNLQNRIIFHGSLFGKDKDFQLYNCDAFVLPSYGEGLPISVLEAWSWRKPVLMTDFCNIPEGFTHEAALKTELTVDSLKENLVNLCSLSETELNKIGNNGYKLVASQFTWSLAANKMQKLYDWLLEKTNSTPDFVYFE